jgi:LysM domain
MAAVAVVLDREEAWVAPVQRPRPELRLVVPPATRPASNVTPSWFLPVVLGCAALLSVIFALSTGDGIPAPADTRGAATALQSVVPPAGAVAATQPGSAYVVQRGDSVWSIAAMAVSAVDVPKYVDSLIALNGSEVLSPGQVLVLPVP